ncbi:agmatine deiminase family protein [Leadbetterella byssophila]|uniref:agmatine deiminase family protein n=1 Tax=Leadbetterella byssophila TaxID=316068 RepID=UPI0039A00B85
MSKPAENGYFFPAEWHPQVATWLSFPINKDTWEDRFDRIYPAYFEFIKTIALSQKVKINANDEATIQFIRTKLEEYNIPASQVELYPFPTNDSWCRDHGPAFLIHKENDSRMIVDWEYNAWGGKYPPYDSDNAIPSRIAEVLQLPSIKTGIVMEGGSVEFNGKGTVLTSKSCLLNKNRNPHLTQEEIEAYLRDYYGVEQVLWVEDGIVGDDTDGHIDDTVRFVNEDTVITVVESNPEDANYAPLKENLEALKKMKMPDGRSLNIVEIQMPDPVYSDGIRLPASYANFLITNGHVIVPTFRSKHDERALQIIQECFKTRKVVGIDATEIIWGLGSFHCLSQQEPKPNPEISC